MKTLSVLIASCACLAAPAVSHAADLATAFDGRIPEVPELTLGGFTLYGVVDVAAQYESHGAPVGDLIYSPQGIISPSNRHPIFLIAPNQEAQSFIGLKTVQKLDYGFSIVAKAEVGFIPTTGRLANALGAVQQNNGVATAMQTANYDGPRAGQPFNGDLYGGLSQKDYGTFTYGRQTTFSLDNIAVYDPLASYGFSLIGYSGVAAGQGGSEEVRTDSSFKYVYKGDVVHAGVLYANPNTSVKDLWQVAAGFGYKGFSFDVAGGHANDEVAVGALSGAANLNSPFLGARVFDTDMVEVLAAYTYKLGGASSISLSGGWERIDFSNPSDGGYQPGHATIGGYVIGPGISTTGLTGGGVVNYPYTGGDRILNISFVALKYQYDEKASVAVAYYRYDQNSFGFGVPGVAPAAAALYSNTSCSSKTFANCSGQEEVVGLRFDYKYNRNINFYAGSTFSVVENGLAFGYLKKQEVDPTIGIKYSF